VIETTFYRIFDLTLRSESPVHELAPCTRPQGGPQLRLVNDSPPTGTRGRPILIQRHLDPERGERFACLRWDRQYLLRFPGVARFHLDEPGQTLYWRPLPGASRDHTRHLLLNQVLPRVFAHYGNVVLHASAVEFAAGAVAFLAPSGHGKSTLAAACTARGARHLGDDALMVRHGANGVWCTPSYRGARLWPTTLNHLAPDGMAPAPDTDYTSKRLLMPVGTAAAQPPPTCPLRCIFVITRGGPNGARASIHCESMAGAQPALELVRQSFVLDWRDKTRAARQFAEVAALIRHGLPVFRLHYPRDFGMLEEVCQRVSDVLEAGVDPADAAVSP
jgi:hypothetical protein